MTATVSPEDGSTVVPAYQWADFFATRFKKITGIKKYQHFKVISSSPGSVFVRELSNSPEQEIDPSSETAVGSRQG